MSTQSKELEALGKVLKFYNDFGNLCASTDRILEEHTNIHPIVGNDKKTISNIKKRMAEIG